MFAVVVAGAAAAAQPSVPVPADPTPAARTAIVVTGERVTRTLHETPSSVVVFGRSDISQLAAPDRLQQLLSLVPNVLTPSIHDTPVIRGQASAGVLSGLPAFLGGARPRTVVQVDGRTITFNEFAFSSEGLWDVDHVEVFRSPQTTTQGVNSIAGAIFMHTADPTWEWEGRARAIAGERARRQLSALVSGPLVPDELALRVSGDLYRAHASNRMSGPVAGVNLNDDRYGTARAKLLARPKALPGVELLTTYAHTHSQAPQVELARRPFRARRDSDYVVGYFKVDVDSLTSVASLPIADSLESRTTVSWGRTHFRRFAPQGFGQTRIHGGDRSLESLLDWAPAGPVSAVGGVSYLATDLDQYIDLSATPFGIGTFDDRQRSRGIFGEASWRSGGGLTITVGSRWQSDTKKRTGILGTNSPLPLHYEKSLTAFLPKVSAAYDLSTDVRVGLLVQRAYNPGGVTLDPGKSRVVRFAPEYLRDYESFVRARFFGDSLNLTANLFYNDIRNAQRTLDVCFETPTGCVALSEIANAPRARSYVAEAEFKYSMTNRLQLRGAVGWLNTRITKTLVPNDPILGKEFAGAPRFTGSTAIEWRPFPRLSVSSQIRHNSSYFGDDAESRELRIRPATTVDARASLQLRRLTMFAYAQNLFDKFHVIAWNGPRNDPNVDATTNDAREIGIGLDSRF